MLTYNTKATVTKDHELEVRLPTELAEGEYIVVVKVNERQTIPVKREPLTFGTLSLGPMKGQTFRREDIYGDDGR